MVRDIAETINARLWTKLPDQAGLPRGDGHAVLVAPGVCTGDFATASVRGFLTRLGYAAHGWGLGLNLGPTRRTVQGIERRLFALNEQSGRPVSLIGVSLGGLYLRELAKRHPDRVRHLFLVCSPTRYPVVSRVATLLLAFEGFYDPLYPRRPEDLNPPAAVPTTAFFTRRDGFLAWQCCLETGPLAENIEIDSGHCVAPSLPLTLRILAARLAAKGDLHQ
jgi:pimeloyl-ACP methyl ester carboxylesterase